MIPIKFTFLGITVGYSFIQFFYLKKKKSKAVKINYDKPSLGQVKVTCYAKDIRFDIKVPNFHYRVN